MTVSSTVATAIPAIQAHGLYRLGAMTAPHVRVMHIMSPSAPLSSSRHPPMLVKERDFIDRCFPSKH
jgi:hypothetical protein